MPTSTSALPGTTILNLPIGLVADGTEQIPAVQGGTTKRFDSMLFISGGLSSAAPLLVPSGGTGTTAFDPYQLIAGGLTSSGPLQQLATGLPGSLLNYVSTGALSAWSTTILAPSSAPILGAQLTANTTTGSANTAWVAPTVVNADLYPSLQAAVSEALTTANSIVWCPGSYTLSTGPVGLTIDNSTHPIRITGPKGMFGGPISGGGNITYTGSGVAISAEGNLTVEIDHLGIFTGEVNKIIDFCGSTASVYAIFPHIHDCQINTLVASTGVIGVDAAGTQGFKFERNVITASCGTAIRLCLDDASKYSVNSLIEGNYFGNFNRICVYSPSDVCVVRNNIFQSVENAVTAPATAGRPAQTFMFESNWMGDHTGLGANLVISNAQVTISRNNFYANSSGAVCITQLSCTGVLVSEGDTFNGTTGIDIGINNALALRGYNQNQMPTTLLTGTPAQTVGVDQIYGRQDVIGVVSHSSFGSTSAIPAGVFATINRSTAALKTPTAGGNEITTVNYQIAAENQSAGFGIDVYGSSVGATPNYISRAARGSQAVPAPLLANDTLFNLVTEGYFGSTSVAYASSYWSPFGALISAITVENWSSASQGSAWDFYTTSSGATNVSNKMRIGRGLMVGTTSDPGTGNFRQAGAYFSPPPVYLTGASGTATTSSPSVVISATNTFTLTLPPSSLNSGAWLDLKSVTAFAVNSTGNIIQPSNSTTAGSVIMTSFAGNTCKIQSNGDGNWTIMGF
jgi:hypothetical protein